MSKITQVFCPRPTKWKGVISNCYPGLLGVASLNFCSFKELLPMDNNSVLPGLRKGDRSSPVALPRQGCPAAFLQSESDYQEFTG